MTLSEAAARISALEQLVEMLLARGNAADESVRDLVLQADTPQASWVARWWELKFSELQEPNIQAALRLEDERTAVFPE